MRILFVGGTGNISTDCAALLHRRGHEIAVLSRGRQTVPPAYESLVANRYEAADMRRVLSAESFDVVVNFLGFRLPELEIDFRLFAGRVRQYIFISSATVYAKPHETLPITEDTPLGNPYSEYARNKQACEEWLLDRYADAGFPVTVVRPSHTYCHRWLPNAISSSSYVLVSRQQRGKPVYLHDDGQNLWTLTAASDFAVGLAGLVGLDQVIGEAVHITSDEALTWNQIYAEIYRAAGIKDPGIVRIPSEFISRVNPAAEAGLIGDKREHAVFDNARIKRLVPEFECRKSVRRGLTESAAWFRAHAEAQQVDPALDALVDRVISAWRQESGGGNV